MVVASPVLVPATFTGIVRDAGIEMLPLDPGSGFTQPVTLRAAVQNLALNFAGAALVAGQVHSYTVVWTEE